ncbi:MAG: exosortase/archaeosortase family protein [Candidatus Limimorpha sp.]
MELSKIKEYRNDTKYKTYFDVGLFFILIFSFHFIYILWSEHLDFWPIKIYVDRLFAWASALLFDQSTWVLDHIFRIDLVTKGDSFYFLNKEGSLSGISVAPECTSLKQWLHWLFLMLIFPGPWKHKAWYIPLGLIIVELTNVVRIVGIALFLIPFPNGFHIAHDYIFKVFFYVVIFLMWVVWVEKITPRKSPSK